MNLRQGPGGRVHSGLALEAVGPHASTWRSLRNQLTPATRPSRPHLSHRPSSFRNWLRTEPTSADRKPRCSSGTAAAAAAAAGVAPAPAAGGGTTPLRAPACCGRGCCAGSGGTPCSPLLGRPAAGCGSGGGLSSCGGGRGWRRRRRRCPHLPTRRLLPGSRVHMRAGTHCCASPARRAGRSAWTGARSGAGARPSAGLQHTGGRWHGLQTLPCNQTGRACNMRAPRPPASPPAHLPALLALLANLNRALAQTAEPAMCRCSRQERRAAGKWWEAKLRGERVSQRIVRGLGGRLTTWGRLLVVSKPGGGARLAVAGGDCASKPLGAGG